MERDMYAKILAKLGDAEGILSSLEGRIAVVTGTFPATEDTYATVDFPDGFTGANCAIIGHAEQNSGGTWYSNNPSITCMTDEINNIRIKTSESTFNSKPFKIILCKT